MALRNPTAIPLIGGEIHYGRVQARYWPAMLDAAKSLGVEVIGAYVMWDYHELREGVYDFASLHEFLALVESRGLRVLARPGPFFYAEWRNLGIPDHAVPFGKHDPRFREKAARWIAAVMEEIRPWLERLIVVVQADNEIDPMPHFYGEDQGFGDWLRRRYDGSIAALNAAWNTDYAGFEVPSPVLAPQALLDASSSEPVVLAGRRAQIADSCRYRYDLATDYARWVIGEYRRNGCSVPILLNTWPGVDAQHWGALADLAVVFGIDPYPGNECRGDFRYFRERLRLLRAVTPYPYIAEFGAGIWHGAASDHTPAHYRLAALTALASGVRGWNWYMLVNRDNWSGAPINERGVVRPELEPVFAEAVRQAKTLLDAPAPEVSIGVTWSWRYHQLAQIRKREADDALLAVLHDSGIEYDFVDVDRPIDAAPPLLLVCGEIEDDSHVWRHVEQGGRIILFQRLLRGCVRPDGTSHPGAEHLEVALPAAAGSAGLAAPIRFVHHGPVLHFVAPPGEAVLARQSAWAVDDDLRRLMQLAVGRTYRCGYVERRGRGSVVVLGCGPSVAAIRAVHEYFGVAIPALPLVPGVHASKRGNRLVVLNRGEAQIGRVQVGARMVEVDLPRCGGAIVDLHS